ncbi:hypothetical protein QFC22_006009 [Naganishia vaughanmartiniae]|uniref:Uncharacterized protein n=1 Tax=Naganishia vaughanmartiniae TaxID=1424756 RepID=A0ACC2WRA4_9TREE|nr:hypothetical protein QFC22_006009 [Naganishia vaughanmartiniae]
MGEYWERRQKSDGKSIEDIFDGSHYRALTEKLVSWNGSIKEPARKYFQDRTDVALGLTTDGVPLYKRSRLDAWPVLLTNFSLPPEVRTREGYQIAADDQGESTASAESNDSQDVPLRLGVTSVRAFAAPSTLVKDRTKTTYYVARKPVDLPDDIAFANVSDIDYNKLPMRSDSDVKRDVNTLLERGITKTLREQRGKEVGISGASIFHEIGSVDFPTSFPVDIMHLLLENVMKQLLEMWDGSFKAATMLGSDTSKHAEPYVLSHAALQKIDAMVTSSNALIPSKMCGTLTAVSSRWRWTADTHLFFLVTLGPIVMKHHLPPMFFDHFIDLSELAKIIIGFSIDRKLQLPYVKSGLQRWVAQFDERIKTDDNLLVRKCHLAVANYLTGGMFTNADMFAGTLKKVTRKEYSQLVDEQLETNEVDAKFSPRTSFGQVIIFLEFSWKRQQRILAIIEPYDTEDWLKVPNSPVLLHQRRAWQALDVRGIMAPSGRVVIEPGRQWVAFETSLGGHAPELVVEEDGNEEGSTETPL